MNDARRAFLASASVALSTAVAGCAGTLGSDGSDTDVTEPERSSPDSDDSDGRSGERGNPPPTASLRMEALSDEAIGRRHTVPERRRSDEERRVVEWAVENGTTTVESESPPLWRASPLKPDVRPFLYDGSVYRLSVAVEDERPATRYFWDLAPAGQADESEVVRFDALPRLDREKFRLVGLGDEDVTADTPLDVGMTFVYANADRDRSALVPTPDRSVIAWESGRRARFSVKRSNSDGATLTTYRYAAERIAPSLAVHGRTLREKYAFDLSGLSDAERDAVDRATNEDGFSVEWEKPAPAAFESLVETFRRHEAVHHSGMDENEDDVDGEYLVAYDGRTYWTELLYNPDSGRGPTGTTATTADR